jgi:hypothetical protein
MYIDSNTEKNSFTFFLYLLEGLIVWFISYRFARSRNMSATLKDVECQKKAFYTKCSVIQLYVLHSYNTMHWNLRAPAINKEKIIFHSLLWIQRRSCCRTACMELFFPCNHFQSACVIYPMGFPNIDIMCLLPSAGNVGIVPSCSVRKRICTRTLCSINMILFAVIYRKWMELWLTTVSKQL